MPVKLDTLSQKEECRQGILLTGYGIVTLLLTLISDFKRKRKEGTRRKSYSDYSSRR
jgi:hypothetical protein